MAAVAKVVADHLVDKGEIADRDDAHRMIKDRVGRALLGQVISTETLDWFADAFGFDRSHVRQLRTLHSGRMPGPGRADPVWEVLGGRVERRIGADGRARREEVSLVLRRAGERVGPFVHPVEPDVASVTVERGGRRRGWVDLGTDPPRRPTPGPGTGTDPPSRPPPALRGVEIAIDEVDPGATASLAVTSRFRPDAPAMPFFRRLFLHATSNLEMRVEFAPAAIPAHLWWGGADRTDEPLAPERELHLDRDRSAHVFVACADRPVMGFLWW